MAKSAGNHITSCRIFWENTDDILSVETKVFQTEIQVRFYTGGNLISGRIWPMSGNRSRSCITFYISALKIGIVTIIPLMRRIGITGGLRYVLRGVASEPFAVQSSHRRMVQRSRSYLLQSLAKIIAISFNGKVGTALWILNSEMW